MTMIASAMELLNAGEDFILATILDKVGSSPRGSGTRMIVKRDFSTVGTIGGGIFEAMVMKLARKMFDTKKSAVRTFSMSGKDASKEGMVCGGKLEVLMEYVCPAYEDMSELLKKSSKLINEDMDFFFISEVRDGECHLKKWVCSRDELFENEAHVNAIMGAVHTNEVRDFKVLSLEGKKYLVQPVLNQERVVIIGAGHIAQKLSCLTAFLEFKTAIVDDRSDFACKERFPDADEIVIIPEFRNVRSHLKLDRNSYVVIVTRGHLYDKEVLSQVLEQNVKYIGMIGSRRKKEFVFQALREEGFSDEELKKVNSPIGLPIGGETPEEIAVSIAAELIKTRRMG